MSARNWAEARLFTRVDDGVIKRHGHGGLLLTGSVTRILDSEALDVKGFDINPSATVGGTERPAQEPIGRDLARTAKLVGQRFDGVLSTEGGSQAVWMVLISLKTHPGANQREIARAAGIQGATLTHHLNAMEEAGLGHAAARLRQPPCPRARADHGGRGGLRAMGRSRQSPSIDSARAGISEGDLAMARSVFARLRQNVER